MRILLLVSTDVGWALRLALGWSAAGDQVSVVLLDAAAATLRPAHPAAALLTAALGGGVVVAVHDGALTRRGLDPRAQVKVVDLDEVADLVASGSDKVVWL